MGGPIWVHPFLKDFDMEFFVEILTDFGPVLAILAFVMWKDYKKEQRDEKKEDELILRLREVEDYQKGVLADLVIESTEALKESTRAMLKCIESLDESTCMVHKCTAILERSNAVRQ